MIGLLVSLALVAVVAGFGRQFTPGPWYQALTKPSWTPPGWVFGPAWTFLYASMAAAAWLVWRRRGTRFSDAALGLYLLQLVFNGLWSWIFFGLHRIGLALADLLVLWVLIVVTTLFFWRVSRSAGILMLPYVAWVAFAGLLNHALWVLNP